MDVLALADDLTGALEVGVRFGAIVEVWRGQACRGQQVIDTENRHMPPVEAAALIREIAAGSRARLIYKKTDSTLRGNIGSELGELLAVQPQSPLIYAPAYPKMGRVVRQGRLHVQGSLAHETAFAKDALNPVRDSDIVRVLRSQTHLPIRSISVDKLQDLKPGTIYVCDGESDAEIAEAARVVIAKGFRLTAGPAAFAEALAERMDVARGAVAPLPRIQSCLVINGSRHELSLRQVCHAVEHGWRLAGEDAIPESEWVILDGAGQGTASQVAANVGTLVRNILTRVRLEALAIFGGDTAYGVLQAIGSPPLEPLREIVPGVPLSRVEGRDLYLITKAGGFGSLDVLSAIRNALL
jgi:uncharacterized protein YgbK (DUF1537 family)